MKKKNKFTAESIDLKSMSQITGGEEVETTYKIGFSSSVRRQELKLDPVQQIEIEFEREYELEW